MKDNICQECGSEMGTILVKGATLRNRKIARYECRCGFSTSVESNSEWQRRVNEEFNDKNQVYER